MIKNIKTIVHAEHPNVTDRAVLVLYNNDFSVTEVVEALSNTLDVEDQREYPLGQAAARAIWDIQPMPYDIDAGAAMSQIEWKLPPKGLPVPEGGGVSIGVLNIDTGNPFSNGPTVHALTKFMGGWF